MILHLSDDDAPKGIIIIAIYLLYPKRKMYIGIIAIIIGIILIILNIAI